MDKMMRMRNSNLKKKNMPTKMRRNTEVRTLATTTMKTRSTTETRLPQKRKEEREADQEKRSPNPRSQRESPQQIILTAMLRN